MITEIENNKCVVCKSTKFTNRYQILLECLNCGHIFSNRKLSYDEIKSLYDIDYFKGNEYLDYEKDKNIILKNFKLRIATLLKHIKKPLNKSLLEIGCAFGFFIEVSQNHFNKIVGIDISSSAINYAKQNYKNTFLQGNFINHQFNNETFDVICMWDTIEHLNEPDKYIKKANNLLNRGGILALSTPDIGSIVAKFRKENWRMIHPPTHLHYFSSKTMCRLLENNNFKIIYKKKCGFYRNIGSMAYIIFVLRLNIPLLYKLLKFLKISNMNLYLNLNDIMYIIAQKK